MLKYECSFCNADYQGIVKLIVDWNEHPVCMDCFMGRTPKNK